MFEDDTPYHGKEDIQPELYASEDGDFVSFDKFVGFEKPKKTLKNFEGTENQFFDAIVYSVMFYKSNGEIIDENKEVEVLGEDSTMTCLKLNMKSSMKIF